MEKWIHIFFSLYRDYSNSLTLSNASELFWSWISTTISKFMKRNVKLGIFTGSRAVDGKEMYKNAWCMCKVVVLPCEAIANLNFSSPPHLKLPIIYDRLWSVNNLVPRALFPGSVKNGIFSGQIELLLLIASQTFFRLIGSSFRVSG